MMSGRTLWGDSPTTSVCAICAHRLGVAARGPHHAQRRLIQSSRPAARPSSEGSAVRRVINESGDTYPASTSGDDRGLGSTSPVRGRPAFGRAASANSSHVSSQVPAFGKPSGVELTEDELRARDVVQNSAAQAPASHIKQPNGRRVIDIFRGAGPASTRGGRPIPIVGYSKATLEWSNLAKQRAMDLDQHFRGSQSQKSDNSVDSTSIPSSIFSQSHKDPDHMKSPSNWVHLRKKNISMANRDIQDPFLQTRAQAGQLNNDPFLKLRAEREQEIGQKFISISGSTPRTSASARESGGNGDQSPTWRALASQSSSKNTNPFRRVQIERWARDDGSSGQNTYSESPRSESTSPRVNYTPQGSAHRLQTNNSFESEESFHQTQRILNERQQTQFSQPDARRSSRFDRSDLKPKSRDRDKARRREQFVTSLDEETPESRSESQRALERKRRRQEKAAARAAAPTPILLPEYISVSNLASALKVRVDEFIEKMEELGFEETDPEHVLNGENAGLIAMEYNFEPIISKGESEDLKARPEPEDRSILPPRPPVVTIMGHVDHGKTTLLDWLRKSSVAATEHGGITQHIGAFSVSMPSGKVITFLDTPGHAAFLSMRQRGANVTDIVVLVVAADDSVKPQTIEAINHAKSAKVPIIVAINKIDKPDANVQRVKQDLARYSVDVEDFGGDTQVVCVSGKTGQGMQELEEAIITLSEIVDMRAEKDGQVEGWVLEASIKSVGKVATILVRRGTLRPGDFIVAGKTWAKIRTLRNEAGVEIDEAPPGTPVQVEGWREQPLAGDEVLQAPDEAKAKRVVEYRMEKAEREQLAQDMEAINEDRRELQERREREKKEADASTLVEEGEEIYPDEKEDSGLKLVNFLVKGDVSGSVEAINDSVAAVGNQEIQPRILRSGVGQVTEFDIEHAEAADGIIINFNQPIDPYISRQAERCKVRILDHNVIYRLVDEVKSKLSEYLPPILSHKVLGEAEVAQVFNITIRGRQQKPIAGCKVRNGTITRNGHVRVLRNGVKVFDGSLESLKNAKKDVTEMHKGNECGMGFDGWTEFQVGDQVQNYETIEEKRHL